jgi:hypothetical protein
MRLRRWLTRSMTPRKRVTAPSRVRSVSAIYSPSLPRRGHQILTLSGPGAKRPSVFDAFPNLGNPETTHIIYGEMIYARTRINHNPGSFWHLLQPKGNCLCFRGLYAPHIIEKGCIVLHITRDRPDDEQDASIRRATNYVLEQMLRLIRTIYCVV